MKIFVTGATGYLGGHFCEYLKDKGHEVTAFIRNPKKASLLDKSDIPYKVGDISDISSISEALKSKYDVIVHCAGFVSDRGPLKLFREINVEGTKNLAEAMLATGHRRLVHISSVAAYGDFGMGIDETYQPRKHKWFKYGLTKLESEEVLNNFDLDVTILRPPHIVGVRDRTGYIPVLYHSMRKSGIWLENGKTLVPVVYLGDVCEALNTCLEKSETIGETYNVSSDEKITIVEIADILHKILGMKIPTKSLSFRFAYSLARIYEFLAIFGVKPSMTRMGVTFAAKSASFSPAKLQKLGWKNTKSGTEMVTDWANWRKKFEDSKNNKIKS